MILLFLTFCTRYKELDLSALPTVTHRDLVQVYDTGDTLYRDIRLQTVRSTGFFHYNPDPAKIEKAPSLKMPEYKTREEWEKRAADLRKHILISTGLWPLPEKGPLNAHIYGKIVHPDYTVEKVYFESYPGFLVTGNLYRPRGKEGPFPAIITPHGHWKHGRLEDSERCSVPARCINFARQGYVVFSWDMVGYLDSGKQVTHRFTDTPQHALWGVSVMGLQLWNSMRAIDFLLSLPEVDSTRIGCTGASGGGTQTFMISAVDQRVKVSAPVNMVSAHFQGGCVCENAPGLRLGTFNVEIAALMAPRPMKLIATLRDWTHDTPKIEYPMIRKIYQLYDAEDHLEYAQFDFPHNYNKTSREAVYPFFAKWLLGDENASKYKEKPYSAEQPEQLLNFPGDEKPPSDLNEQKLTDYLIEKSQETFTEYWPESETEFKRFESVYGTALRDILAAQFPQKIDVIHVGDAAGDDFKVSRLLISRSQKEDWIPAIFYQPAKYIREAALIVHGKGKSAVVPPDSNKPGELVSGLLAKGVNVLVIDVFKIGEHNLAAGMRPRDETVKHFVTYNRTDAQEQIQDILTAVKYLEDYDKIQIIGLEDAGPLVILSSVIIQDVSTVVADCMYQNWEDEEFLLQKLFIPGLARYGGLATALLLTSADNIEILQPWNPDFIKRIQETMLNCGLKKKIMVHSEINIAENILRKIK